MSDQYKGLPIKDRSPDDIREALKGQDEETVKWALALHDYAVKHHLGLSRLADQTRIQSGILSPFFNGAYEGDPSAIAKRIENFFWSLKQKELYGGIREFCETRLAAALWRVYEKTRIIRRIQIVQGPEQVGKTRAAREYSARHNSGRTVFVSAAGGTRNGCGAFIWDLAERLDIPYSVKLLEKRTRIKQKLEACDLIIIDEQHLVSTWTDRAQMEWYDYVRVDLCNNGARGIIWQATNHDVLKGIYTFRHRSGYNVGQLFGRMRVETMQIDPAEDIVEEDVESLMSRYGKFCKSTVRLIHELATREQLGHFGLVEDIMNEAWTRAKSRKKELSDDIVKDTAAHILETLKSRKDLLRRPGA